MNDEKTGKIGDDTGSGLFCDDSLPHIIPGMLQNSTQGWRAVDGGDKPPDFCLSGLSGSCGQRVEIGDDCGRYGSAVVKGKNAVCG